MGTTRTTDKTDTTASTAATDSIDSAEKRTDDETVPAQAAATEGAKAPAASPETTDAAERDAGETEDTDGVDLDLDEDLDATARRTTAGVAAGAGAVVAAGLGLASVTGTWLGTLMAERQTLMGQINLQAGKATDQISAMYGTPWHTTALVNGVFAVLAALVAAVVLTRPRATWVRAVAWGGLALGVLGLLISAGMYLDLFGSMPTIPKGTRPGA
ncbi:hypothetical protein [Streptomyces endophytica]|uniref:Integral membrane protein n=1 Tax=Streptomyces endophytica TaxID=2991496 RepID=A0ABY6P723_9ACTN|nr:hypothetical protein [Streptomyces endophytica]UZJ29447.1 hypothetical protein OJ254_01805 [Streptomyces endophytica]